MNFLKNIPAETLTVSGCVIGFLLIDDFTPAEQNSLGNFFMLIGQILCSNSAQQQVINNAKGTSNTANQHTVNSNLTPREMMEKVRDAFDTQINNLK